MITVVSYLKGIPAGNKNPEKPASLTNFIKGVKANGDNGIVSDDSRIIDADVAVIQGYVHEDGKQAPHLALRKQIIDYQKLKNKRTIIIDSNLFLYRDPGNTKGYLRYSFDGVFPCTGEYCYESPDPARWEKIKRDIGFDLKPWRSNGSHILLCLQRNGGWSMKSMHVVDFFKYALAEIRKYSDRPIVVRTHPGDKKSINYITQLVGKNVTISNKQSLVEDLEGAWATVVFNSSPSVASVIEGVPAFVIDPSYSQSSDVANLGFSRIETPDMPERIDWVRKMAQCHWSLNDLADGSAWKHMKKWAYLQ